MRGRRLQSRFLSMPTRTIPFSHFRSGRRTWAQNGAWDWIWGNEAGRAAIAENDVE